MVPPLSDDQAAFAGPQLENMPVHLPSTDDAMRAFNAMRQKKRKTASSSRLSQLGPPPRALPTGVPITSTASAELGIETVFPVENEGATTEQLHEVELTFSRSSSIWTDDQLVEQFARSLMIPGDESKYADLTSTTMVQRMRMASIRVHVISSFSTQTCDLVSSYPFKNLSIL